MLKNTRPVVICGGKRIPFCKAGTAYMTASNQDMATHAVQSLVDQFDLKSQQLGEVTLGAVIKHSKDWNLAREVVLGTTLSPHTPGITIQRACGTSLDAAILIANKIAVGQIEAGIAGGADTVSDIPVVFSRKFAQRMMRMNNARSFWQRLGAMFKGFRFGELKPRLPGVAEPRTGMSMGQHCELMAKEWNIARADQDQMAYDSHQKAAKAYEEGFFDDLVTPFLNVERDNILRPQTSLEKLASLRTVFDKSDAGTLTAGNSTPLTDGASSVLLATEEWARERGLPIQAYLRDAQVAAVDYVDGKEGLLMAPAYAVPQMLDRAGISLQDFDIYEIHEAFAAQVLCTLKAWESDQFCKERLGRDSALGTIDRNKLNPKGSSLAVGHPFAATGARIVATLAKELAEGDAKRGLISVCTAGGMGVTAILEKA